MTATESAALHFPEHVKMPESWQHMEVRTLLWQFLKLAFSDVATVGSDQFVYWDPADPTACLAPDGFVRMGQRHEPFRSWKVWQRGPLHVAIEIISPSDDEDWPEKFAKYRRLGVLELIWFDREDAREPLRVWDLESGDLAPRPSPGRRAFSPCLKAFWQVLEDPELGLTLRLSRDEAGTDLFLTPTEREARERHREARARQREASARKRESEARKRESEARKRESEARKRESEARAHEARARRRAEERVRELEAELARKKA